MENLKCAHCGSDNPATSKYCSRCGYELPKIKTETPVPPLQAVKTPNANNKRKQILGVVFGIITMFASYFIIQQLFFKPSIDKALLEVANEINKNCPIMVDESTRLDNVITIPVPENSFQYNYTLITMEKSQVSIEEMKNFLEPKIINTVKTSPDMKLMREHKTTLVYQYVDKNSVFLLKIKVTPAMYE